MNHPQLVSYAIPTLESALGKENVIVQRPQMGAEDFACFAEKIPGFYFWLGVRNETKGITRMLHTPEFDVDENCLSIGVSALSHLVLSYLQSRLSLSDHRLRQRVHNQLRIRNENFCAWWYRPRQPNVSADDRTFSDDRVSAQDGGSGVNHDIIFNGRVALEATDQSSCIIFRKTKRSQRDTLIEFDILANHGGFSNDDSRSVIDKKVMSNLSTRMDIDSGLRVGNFRDHARQERDPLLLQFVGHPINHDGKDARVTKDHLVVAF